MGGDVLDPLAVDVDFAAVAQRFQKFHAGERPLLAGDDRFGMFGHGVLHFVMAGLVPAIHVFRQGIEVLNTRRL